MAEDHLKPENKALAERVLGYGTARTYNLHEIDRLLDAAREEGRSAVSAERPGDAILSLATYNAGLLSDHGGGNVSWWQDYIRAELAYAHDFYQAQVDAYWPLSAVPATPEGEENQQDSSSRNTGNHQCADAGPSPRSQVSFQEAPVDVPLWGVYGPDCFPTVFACRVLEYLGSERAVWGYSVHEGEPGYRTLGAGPIWAEGNYLRLFLTREAAFASIAACFPPDGGEAVHSQPSDQAPAEPSSSEEGGCVDEEAGHILHRRSRASGLRCRRD